MTPTKEALISQLDRLHTTKLGLVRIRKNLGLETDDVVDWCKAAISSLESTIIKNGKNYYATCADSVITVNASSYTIITAHRVK